MTQSAELPNEVGVTGQGPLFSWTGWASVRDSADFAEQLATLTRTGLPLPSGLRALAKELPSRRLRPVLVRTAERLEQGDSLDDAMTMLANRFPPQLRGLMIAGCRSGKLAEVLGQYVFYANLGDTLRRRLWMSIAYPLVLLGALGMLYVFLCVWVVDSFKFILKDFGVKVPPITEVLFILSDLTRERGPQIMLLGGVIFAILFAIFRLTMKPPERRTILSGIPLIGPLLRFSTLAEFCHLAGLLVEAEMPLPEALSLSGDGVNDAELGRAGSELRKSVEQGRTLSESLVFWPRCPAGLREILNGSEGRGDLAPSLHMAGDMYEARTRTQSSFVSTTASALCVIAVIWGIGFFMAALYLPIITLLGKLVG
jgi:type II secretory pathway component PulF